SVRLSTVDDYTNGFIAKYNSTGNLVWAHQVAGGAIFSAGYGIALDASDNVYVTGEFTGLGYFGTTSVGSTGGSDIFVAKYNTSGSLLWVNHLGGPESDFGNSIAVDGSGNAYVTGGFRNSISFGNDWVNSSGG